jgi:protoheme IX farnesyltransferase
MTNNPGNILKDYLALSKIKIMIPVSLTGFTGYFAYSPHFSLNLFLSSLGILLMSVAASVLNQIQEIPQDSRMTRTSLRPLPAKKIKINQAAIFFIFNLAAGMMLIYVAGNLRAALIGLATIIWYNGVYTYAKRVTAFAVVPGALTGALPPLIGWVAAGGAIFDKPIIFIEFLIFVGQIPHFWLLILKYGDEYKQAGFPSLTDVFTKKQISRMTFSWVISSVISALFLCYFEIIKSQILVVILLIASTYLLREFFSFARSGPSPVKRYSIIFDSYFLLVLLLLISDKIIG